MLHALAGYAKPLGGFVEALPGYASTVCKKRPRQ